MVSIRSSRIGYLEKEEEAGQIVKEGNMKMELSWSLVVSLFSAWVGKMAGGKYRIARIGVK